MAGSVGLHMKDFSIHTAGRVYISLMYYKYEV